MQLQRLQEEEEEEEEGLVMVHGCYQPLTLLASLEGQLTANFNDILKRILVFMDEWLDEVVVQDVGTIPLDWSHAPDQEGTLQRRESRVNTSQDSLS